jgi:ATP-dependent helicase HepA
MWLVGQRVFSEFEPELGLGMVIKVTDSRRVEVLFATAEVTRQYIAKSAPLRRLVLTEGQQVQSKDGHTVTVKRVQEIEGLYLYVGKEREIWEYEIGHVLDNRDAFELFLRGQWSKPTAFDLRRKSWFGRAQGLDPELRGIVAARVALLPHQLYIAYEAGKRDFPRLLLADEVGLGKTIEAGLIFSAMKALGRADRVLIVVPDALKHQWLAEMYRCFHELFALIDVERIEQEEISQGASAFRMNQRVVCSLDLLAQDADYLKQALEEPWDLVIVDEAHHLDWDPKAPSPEWDAVRWLSRRTRGLLLLTATPEFSGLETKFGLLNLVDPERFSDFESFQEEMAGMKKNAELAQKVQAGDRAQTVLRALRKLAKTDRELLASVEAFEKGGSPEPVLRALIDRHGTGRVFVRNRRARLKGFPGRKYFPAPLPVPPAWAEHLKSIPAESAAESVLLDIATGRGIVRRGKGAPEAFGARCRWLLERLESLKGAKVLLIAGSIQTVLAIEAWLKGQTSIRTGVFHEELEIVERDRQAAWFAQGDGAQVLICSEIGGEGRNFQFASHLVLFDLPEHPDVLEQRIGRLDRIGQKKEVHVHVPFFEGTPEEVLLGWFADGLGSFSQAWGGGNIESDAELDLLFATCRAYLPKSKAFAKRRDKMAALIKATQAEVLRMRDQQAASIDVLVDLNSFDEQRGTSLVSKAAAVDADPTLRSYLTDVFEHYGVEVEELDSAGTLKVSAHSLSFVDHFPGLSAHGERLITFDRAHALSREEVAFISWDHPMVHGALSLVLDGPEGQASAAIWSGSGQRADLWLELLFVLQVTAPAYLETGRDLSEQSWHLVFNARGDRLERVPAIPPGALKPLPPDQLLGAVPDLRGNLSPVVKKATELVRKRAARSLEEAAASFKKRSLEQQARLAALAKINPLISKKEIAAQGERIEIGMNAFNQAQPRLDAIRLIWLQ